MSELHAIEYVDDTSLGMREVRPDSDPPLPSEGMCREDLSHCGQEALQLPACGAGSGQSLWPCVFFLQMPTLRKCLLND